METKKVRYYTRPKEFYISGIEDAPYASIILPIGEKEYFIQGNQIEEKSGAKRLIKQGDELEIAGYKITFFEDYLEVEGDFEEGQTISKTATDVAVSQQATAPTTVDDNQVPEIKKIHQAKILLEQINQPDKKFDGYPIYKRSPRIIYRVPDEKIEIKQPQSKKTLGRDGLAELIIPVLSTAAFTVAMGFFLKRGPYVYMSIGMTIITLIFSVRRFFKDKKKTKEYNIKRKNVYIDYLLRMRKKIIKKQLEEKIAYEYISPTTEDVLQMVEEKSSRLYERNLIDDDFLEVCMGYFDGNSALDIKYARDELTVEKDDLEIKAKDTVKEFKKMKNIPLSVSLRKANLGLVGSKENVNKKLKRLLAQITFFHSYHDLEIVFINDAKYEKDFEYIKWYPHLKIHSINVSGRICSASGKETLSSLQQILKERKQILEEDKKDHIFKPYFLFVINEPKIILNHPIMEYLQEMEMDLGFSVIYTTENEANLPEYINTIVLLENSEKGRLLIEEGERKNKRFNLYKKLPFSESNTRIVVHEENAEVQNYLNNNAENNLESAFNEELEKTARQLAAIEHEEGMSSRIPESVTFFDMYKVKKPQDFDSRKRWSQNQSHKTLAVPLGLRAEDDIVSLNLHEKAHGPHGLVAGTTGSGKSEIVQSYILSLALNFHPYEVGFLLIDYKGGGMANLFKDLPHLLGTITNLDKAESMRAMASIHSELLRRQQIFSECGVNHINGYNKLFKEGKVKEPLPHLFMISDEFAELKSEQPEFMAELISTARIGRSLGIHLILATQKPSGVVDDQIWSNSRFKLCLKVADTSDSKEMLKTPDAASITQAGRAYLQVGNNEIYELFQSAWSGAKYNPDENANEEKSQKEDNRVYLINEKGQGQLINKDLSDSDEDEKKGNDITQLDATVMYLNKLYNTLKQEAKEEGKEFPEVKKPWLPSLDAPIESPYTKVEKIVDTAIFEKGDFTLSVGMVDVPEEQRQTEYVVDFVKNGHLLYMASSGYGKSMFLTNVITGLAVKNAVQNFKSYIIDLGNSALIPLKNLPHVADYMGFDDAEKLSKFIKIITEEISSRKKKFAHSMAQNISVYNESARNEAKKYNEDNGLSPKSQGYKKPDTLSVILIAIDNYDALKELGDDMEMFVQKLARDGASLGIYIATTMTRCAAMRAVVLNNFKEKIAGYNFDNSEIRSLIGRTTMDVPEDKKGRALVKLDEIDMMQLYTPVPCPDELTYIEKLKEFVSTMAKNSTEKKAKGIPVLPEELHISNLPEYPGYEEMVGVSTKITQIPVGIETEQLNVVGLDISKGMGLIVGETQMGRTTLLKNIISFICKDNRSEKIYIMDNSSMGLAKIANECENASYQAGSMNSYNVILKELTEDVQRRKEDFEDARIDEQLLTPIEFTDRLQRSYIVIDVIQEITQLYKDEMKLEELDILSDAMDWGIVPIVASDTRFGIRNGKLVDRLQSLKNGIILGDATAQMIFEVGRMREHNKDIHFGYQMQPTGIRKIMLADEI